MFEAAEGFVHLRGRHEFDVGGDVVFGETKPHAIADARAEGTVRAGDPFDLMAMVIVMSMAWSPVSNVYAATDHEPAQAHE